METIKPTGRGVGGRRVRGRRMVRAWPLVGWEASSPDKGEGQKLGEGCGGGVSLGRFIVFVLWLSRSLGAWGRKLKGPVSCVLGPEHDSDAGIKGLQEEPSPTPLPAG